MQPPSARAPQPCTPTHPPLQGAVPLNILAVLIQGGGPDALQLPPRQRRLQQVGDVQPAAAATAAAPHCASPHQGVHLINHEDDVAL